MLWVILNFGGFGLLMCGIGVIYCVLGRGSFWVFFKGIIWFIGLGMVLLVGRFK